MMSRSKRNRSGGSPGDYTESVGELIFANPGITKGEILKKLGIVNTQLDVALRTLTSQCYIWEDDDIRGDACPVTIEYWFPKGFDHGDDLFAALFGVRTEDVLQSMKNKPFDADPSVYDLGPGATLHPEETRNARGARTGLGATSLPTMEYLKGASGAFQ